MVEGRIGENKGRERERGGGGGGGVVRTSAMRLSLWREEGRDAKRKGKRDEANGYV